MRKLISLFTILICFLMSAINSNAQVNVFGAVVGNGSYLTLKDAFDAINGGAQTGAAISVDIVSNTTETAMATLNANDWVLLNIAPTSGPVSVTGPDTAVIKLEGADNVTINGSPSLDGPPARDLSIIGTRTATNSAGIWLAHGSSIADSNGAMNNIISNCEISCGIQTDSLGTNFSFGIYSGGATIGVITEGRFNDNNQILQNRIVKCVYGINMIGGGAFRNGTGNVINGNLIGPDSFGDDQIRNMGIHVQFQSGCSVSMNEVQHVGGPFLQQLNGGFDRIGIGIGTNGWTALSSVGGDYIITDNKVHHVLEQQGFSAAGIIISTFRIGSSPTNNLIANNEIYNILANAVSPSQCLGIAHTGFNGRDLIVYNSIYMVGDLDEAGAGSANQTCGGIRVATDTDAGVTVRNNSIYVDLTSNNASLLKVCIQMPSSTYNFGTAVLDNNDYYFPGANTQMRTGALGIFPLAATFFTTLVDWQGVFTPPQDGNSIQSDPLYFLAPPYFLIPQNGSPLLTEAAPIASVPIDILDEPRSPTAPTIGCYEYTNSTVPVEISTLTASVNNSDVTLYWTTVSELNNSGFDIERRLVNSEWTRIGNVQGHGTVTTPQNYIFNDRGLSTGKYNYRLKQIDFNGNFEYFNLSNEIGIGVPTKYDLSQNYPNPFNPATKISYDLPVDGKVSLKIFDMTGREIATLVNDVQPAGYYTINYNASSLSSGVYFYTITSNNFATTKKMMLVK